ncbi:MAG TPA: hypothetical protein VFP34_00160 [Microlunatus sp.]|nr:hypothetical protein [Microlunatus sp.]
MPARRIARYTVDRPTLKSSASSALMGEVELLLKKAASVTVAAPVRRRTSAATYTRRPIGTMTDQLIRECPKCGTVNTGEPNDIGDGPEFVCATCQWCWGANGQVLGDARLKPYLEKQDVTVRVRTGRTYTFMCECCGGVGRHEADDVECSNCDGTGAAEATKARARTNSCANFRKKRPARKPPFDPYKDWRP